MKTYYDILGLTPQASMNEINNAAKMHIKNIESSNLLKSSEKKDRIKKLRNAYTILNDYHSRREYDDTILLKPIDISSHRKHSPFGMSVFNNNFMNLDGITDIMKNMNISENSYQSYTSSTNGHLDQSGQWITEQKQVSNKNGKVDANHIITTKDKNGKTVEVKKIPVSINKKKISPALIKK